MSWIHDEVSQYMYTNYRLCNHEQIQLISLSRSLQFTRIAKLLTIVT